MFEVFTLGMLSMSELHDRWERWEAPGFADSFPEGLRRLLTTRPRAPDAGTARHSVPMNVPATFATGSSGSPSWAMPRTKAMLRVIR